MPLLSALYAVGSSKQRSGVGTVSTILWMRKLRLRNRWGFPKVTQLVHEVGEFRTQDSRVVGMGRGNKKRLGCQSKKRGHLGIFQQQ